MQTILVVDDNDVMRTLVVDILGEKYKVISAPDGEKALELFKKNESEVKLIITDLDMPIMDGFELSKAIRNLSTDVKIIVYSSSIDEYRTLSKLSDFKINEFLLKPVKLQEIRKSVEFLLKD